MKALPRGNSVVEDEDCLRFYLKLTFVTTNQSVTTIGYFTKMLDPFLTVLDWKLLAKWSYLIAKWFFNPLQFSFMHFVTGALILLSKIFHDQVSD